MRNGPHWLEGTVILLTLGGNCPDGCVDGLSGHREFEGADRFFGMPVYFGCFGTWVRKGMNTIKNNLSPWRKDS